MKQAVCMIEINSKVYKNISEKISESVWWVYTNNGIRNHTIFIHYELADKIQDFYEDLLLQED